ncbi:MAG: zinc ribbon domain-containing protein [Calditrichaeota bacterium]|nr:MAG: zinc ribbon domain-containing protein [Calditrichota bacterium]
MPIYEFYCEKCNTIYKFFSRTVNTEKIPSCPNCKDVSLERRMSMFALSSGRKDEDMGDDMPPIDEDKMERAMALLANEADKINEDDPRQAAQLMRKFSELTGMEMGPAMEEAIRRMEQGEDPEQIEEEMGDLLEGDELFTFASKVSGKKKKPKPKIDDTIYDL